MKIRTNKKTRKKYPLGRHGPAGALQTIVKYADSIDNHLGRACKGKWRCPKCGSCIVHCEDRPGQRNDRPI